MRHIIQLLFPSNSKPWLIIGKGPSFSKIWDLDLKKYYTIGLNHVSSKIQVDISHCIDIDVLNDDFNRNSTYVLMPYHPHIKFKATRQTLEDLFLKNKFIQELDIANKLYYYYCSTWRDNKEPKVKVKYFSAEAVFNILIQKGIKKIYTLGIDGGNQYAKEFSDKFIPLGNGRNSFDVSLDYMAKIAQDNNVEWIKL